MHEKETWKIKQICRDIARRYEILWQILLVRLPAVIIVRSASVMILLLRLTVCRIYGVTSFNTTSNPRSKDLNKTDGSNSDWTKNARTRSPMRYYNSDNKTVEELWDKIFNQPSSANGGSNNTVAEAIQQAKKQLEELRKTSNKAVSNQKEHIKKLSEQMRSKDGQLQSVDKELGWLVDENKKLKDEFQDTDKRYRQKEDEVARLTQLLRERDFMLQQKQEYVSSSYWKFYISLFQPQLPDVVLSSIVAIVVKCCIDFMVSIFQTSG